MDCLPLIVIPNSDNGYVGLNDARELQTECYVIIHTQLSLYLREAITG